MALIFSERSIVAAGNYVNPVNCSVAIGNITTIPGFSQAQLKWESPSNKMKAASASSPCTIEHNFTAMASTPSVNVLGIINHNLSTANLTTIQVFKGSGQGTSLGTWGITNDLDVMIRFDVETNDYFSIKLSGSSVGSFYVGSIFWGLARELDVNPADAFFSVTQRSSITIEEAGGGDLVVLKSGRDRRRVSLEAAWERMTGADINHLSNIKEGELVGIQPPEQTDTFGAYGTQHIWGYVIDITSSPRSYGGASNKRYDGLIRIEGAV